MTSAEQQQNSALSKYTAVPASSRILEYETVDRFHFAVHYLILQCAIADKKEATYRKA